MLSGLVDVAISWEVPELYLELDSTPFTITTLCKQQGDWAVHLIGEKKFTTIEELFLHYGLAT